MCRRGKKNRRISDSVKLFKIIAIIHIFHKIKKIKIFQKGRLKYETYLSYKPKTERKKKEKQWNDEKLFLILKTRHVFGTSIGSQKK